MHYYLIVYYIILLILNPLCCHVGSEASAGQAPFREQLCDMFPA